MSRLRPLSLSFGLLAGAAAVVWAATPRPHARTLSEAELAAVVGGTRPPGLCLLPPAGTGCNLPDTSCGRGDDCCAQIQAEEVFADEIDFKAPTVCTITNTTLYCGTSGRSTPTEPLGQPRARLVIANPTVNLGITGKKHLEQAFRLRNSGQEPVWRAWSPPATW